jgi:hypothetical protein
MSPVVVRVSEILLLAIGKAASKLELVKLWKARRCPAYQFNLTLAIFWASHEEFGWLQATSLPYHKRQMANRCH